jgi:hypothetical protein
VFWATGKGLRVLPGHEELIALRMRAHARAGDLAGVRQEWESYERVLVADAWSDGEPAPKLLALRRELLSPSTTDAAPMSDATRCDEQATAYGWLAHRGLTTDERSDHMRGVSLIATAGSGSRNVR